MNKKVGKQKVLSSMFWKMIERLSAQGIAFVLSIILARLLMPEDYGIIALTTIFIRIANVFITSGLGAALIQNKDVSDVDYSSVFYLSFAIACIMYVGIFFAAPSVAEFYEEPDLVGVLRLLCLTLPMGALSSVQNAIVSKKLLFRKQLYVTLISVIISGTTGIFMAYKGFGVWALVTQQIVLQSVTILSMTFIVKWWPKLLFSISRIKVLFSFSFKLLISSVMEVLFNEVRGLIIGKMYNSTMLGLYNRGRKLPERIMMSVNSTIQAVMFPTLASHQDDKVSVKKIVKRTIKLGTYIVFPVMMGMAVVAEPMVSILLTDKWLPSVPYIQIFCASCALWPIHTTSLQVLKALGQSGKYLKLEIIKKVIGIIFLLASIPFGVFYMALSVPITGVIAVFVNASPSRKLINYMFKEMIKDILPALILSVLMGAGVLLLGLLPITKAVLFVIQILGGIVIYILLSMLFKNDSFVYLLSTIKDFLKKRKKIKNSDI